MNPKLASFAVGFVLCAMPALADNGQTVLYAFGTSGVPRDGTTPSGDLVADDAGNFYGTTAYGGAHNKGTVFRLSPISGGWQETVLYSFGGREDGLHPIQGLARDKNGALYGTTPYSGPKSLGNGVVFKLTPPALPGAPWTEDIIYRFCSVSGCGDGSIPNAPLSLGPHGVLYGSTTSGGDGGGVVFTLTPPRKGGTWTYTILAKFSDQGWSPWGPLLLQNDGSILGTTGFSGGLNHGGTLFKLTPSGDGYQVNILHDFGIARHDGTSPIGVVADQSGVLYGVTEFGGQKNCGSVFSYDPAAASYEQIYSFCPNGDGTGGRATVSKLVIHNGTDGKATVLYGTAESSDVGDGTVFKLTRAAGSGTWNETVLHTFCPTRSNCSDGAFPTSGLFPRNGEFFGLTAKGGRRDRGVVFQLDKRAQ